MISLYSIATDPSTLAIRTNVSDVVEYAPVYQARPGMKMPIIIFRNDKPEIVMATWGLRSNASFNTVHTSRILKTRPWNLLIRRQRCAIPANCFIVNKTETPHLIRLPQHRLFMMGGVYHEKNDEIYFTFLLTEAADIISTLTEEMPVIFHNDRVHKWLTTEDLGSIMRYADKAGNNWFDYFKVDPEILTSKENNRELLTPLGMSDAQMKQRDKQVMAVNFEKERMNRRGYK